MAKLDKDIIIQYALGELSSDEMDRVKREIDNDPAAQEELKTYQLSLGDLDKKFQEIHDEPIPSHISQRIDQVSSSLSTEKKRKNTFLIYFGTATSGGVIGAILTALYMSFFITAPMRVAYNDLNEELPKLKDNVSELSLALNNKDEKINELTSTMDQLNSEFETVKLERDDKINELTSTLDQLNSEFEIVKLERDAAKMGGSNISISETETVRLVEDSSKMDSLVIPLFEDLLLEDILTIQDTMKFVFDDSNMELESSEVILLASLDATLSPMPIIRDKQIKVGNESLCDKIRDENAKKSIKPIFRIADLKIKEKVFRFKAFQTPDKNWHICSSERKN